MTLRAGPGQPAQAKGSSRPDPVLPRAPLRPREREVMLARFRGMTLDETAAKLGIRVDTVKLYVTNAYRALGVDSLIEAARALGYLRLPDEPESSALADRIRLLPSIEPSPYSFPDLVERADVLAVIEECA